MQQIALFRIGCPVRLYVWRFGSLILCVSASVFLVLHIVECLPVVCALFCSVSLASSRSCCQLANYNKTMFVCGAVLWLFVWLHICPIFHFLILQDIFYRVAILKAFLRLVRCHNGILYNAVCFACCASCIDPPCKRSVFNFKPLKPYNHINAYIRL